MIHFLFGSLGGLVALRLSRCLNVSLMFSPFMLSQFVFRCPLRGDCGQSGVCVWPVGGRVSCESLSCSESLWGHSVFLLLSVRLHLHSSDLNSPLRGIHL